MSAPLFVLGETGAAAQAGDVVELSGDEGRHAVSVARLGLGESVDLADGRGLVLRGRVVAVEGRDLLRARVQEVVLFGASREHFEKAWQGIVPISWYETMEPAVRFATANAKNGDVVLLAPATSSYDLYKNYEQRGDDFKRIVGMLS